MATITEDFVSFETAKLLKEKDCPDFGYSCICDSEGNKAQTQSIIMKWLRENHNIHFIFDPYLDDKYNVKYFIVIVFGNNVINPIYKTKGDSSYEQACEEAIKYSFEHLI